jgi:hypothetical protein
VKKFFSPATREHAIMEETFSVRSMSGLCNRTSIDESVRFAIRTIGKDEAKPIHKRQTHPLVREDVT